MKRECSCSGHCGDELNRREFLQIMLTGAAGTLLIHALPAAGEDEQPTVWQVSKGTLPSSPSVRTYPAQTPRTYQGKNLEYVLMPIGGIGTGTVWLDGRGRLSVWQVFNNYTEEGLSQTHFALRLGGEIYLLETAEDAEMPALPVISYEGGYPVARLHYDTADLPVGVTLEAFNPLIPLDAFHSSLPCAIFRWTVRNRSRRRVDLRLLLTLPRSWQEGEALAATPGYERYISATPILPPGAYTLRDRQTRREVSPAPLYHLMLTQPDFRLLSQISAAVRTLEQGGVVLVTAPESRFWQEWQPRWEVFEDFEGENYGKWQVEGTAFGTRPHTGTTPGQQPVSGFWGKGLVNTYLPNDEPQGTLTSPPFTIRKRYIGFLIGGGAHPGETCINLIVDGKVVRTATGRNNERLEPYEWNVAEFLGKQARIQIVDRHSGGWGHINVDHIVFSDESPVALFSAVETMPKLREALLLKAKAMHEVNLMRSDLRPQWTEQGRHLFGEQSIDEWRLKSYLQLQGFEQGDWQVLAQMSNGDPLLLMRQYGRGKVLLLLSQPLLESNIPWDMEHRIPSWNEQLLLAALGMKDSQNLVLQPAHPRFGSIAVKTDVKPLFSRWSTLADLRRPQQNQPTEHGAIEVPLTLQPGQARTVHFVLGWYYPNVERFGHRGNLYTRWFRSAKEVTDYVLKHLDRLWGWTRLYHQTMYESNLPPLMLDAITSQAVILRGPTCFWSEDGYFGGFEGSYACCPLNCTHVWNYAQTHARLFPEIGRNMRESDLLVYLHPNGETSHRQHAPHNAFIDGQCATICAAYREHLTSPDSGFLRRVWNRVKLATDWLISAIDPDEDGVPSGHQWNTYDCAVSGASTFIGSQYLCALAAAEQMAVRMGDNASAQRYRRIRLAGTRNQDAQLWNGEYYIQEPGTPPANDYNTGCHSDQLLGQWWAHQLGLGYLYPRERVRQALQAIYRYNFRRNMHGHRQIPRRYVLDDEGGLLMCTWPHGGRPDPFIIYADEVWTGIEYSTAGLMLWEGMVKEAVEIVNTARSRYDGRRRDGLDSGPGGNPFSELECGKFYARAMSSFGLLLAAQGLILDTPNGVLGFAPHWQPEDHRTFFITGTGWGLFIQKRGRNEQWEEIDLRYGSLRLREIVFQLPDGATLRSASVQIGRRMVETSIQIEGNRLTVRFAQQQNLQAPARITVRLLC